MNPHIYNSVGVFALTLTCVSLQWQVVSLKGQVAAQVKVAEGLTTTAEKTVVLLKIMTELNQAQHPTEKAH
jgi:hypothetical protein